MEDKRGLTLLIFLPAGIRQWWHASTQPTHMQGVCVRLHTFFNSQITDIQSFTLQIKTRVCVCGGGDSQNIHLFASRL